jgi:hypothetical protein
VNDIGNTPANALLVRGTDKYNNFLNEKRLEAPGSPNQFDYHLSLMKQFRKRQDEGASFSKAKIE